MAATSHAMNVVHKVAAVNKLFHTAKRRLQGPSTLTNFVVCGIFELLAVVARTDNESSARAALWGLHSLRNASEEFLRQLQEAGADDNVPAVQYMALVQLLGGEKGPASGVAVEAQRFALRTLAAHKFEGYMLKALNMVCCLTPEELLGTVLPHVLALQPAAVAEKAPEPAQQPIHPLKLALRHRRSKEATEAMIFDGLVGDECAYYKACTVLTAAGAREYAKNRLHAAIKCNLMDKHGQERTFMYYGVVGAPSDCLWLEALSAMELVLQKHPEVGVDAAILAAGDYKLFVGTEEYTGMSTMLCALRDGAPITLIIMAPQSAGA